MSIESWLLAGAGLSAIVAAVAHLVIVWGRRTRVEPRPEVIDTRVADRLAAGYDLAQAELEERTRVAAQEGLAASIEDLANDLCVTKNAAGHDLERVQHVWAGDFERLDLRIHDLEEDLISGDYLKAQVADLALKLRRLEADRYSLVERVKLLESPARVVTGRPVAIEPLQPLQPAFPVAAFPGKSLIPGQLSDEHPRTLVDYMRLRSVGEERF